MMPEQNAHRQKEEQQMDASRRNLIQGAGAGLILTAKGESRPASLPRKQVTAPPLLLRQTKNSTLSASTCLSRRPRQS